ncbi:MAG: dipicolinate synthase subunit DpsA [Clostridia bacterium]
MSTNFAVIGGDLRIIKLVKMLAEDGNTVYTYGLEKAEELKGQANIIFSEKLSKAIPENIEIVIGPIPFSSNGININAPFGEKEISIRELMHHLNAKILIAGSISPDIYDMANDEYIEIIDIMKREELAVLNTISTAEGAIEIAIANTNKIIHGSNILILGFGRIGKVLARKMAGLSARVTCAARKDEDLAWIKAYGHRATNINFLGENLSEFDIIINTVPHLILTQERMQYIKNDCLLIDLASNPGGIDKKSAKEKSLKLIWALALPGKVAPITTAEFIKDTIYNILKEIYKK